MFQRTEMREGGATLWARSTKNVKKPQSNVQVKFEVSLHFWGIWSTVCQGMENDMGVYYLLKFESQTRDTSPDL